LSFHLSMKPPFDRFDLLSAGPGTGCHILRHDPNRIPTPIRRKFQDAPERPIVVDRRSSGLEAANGCSCVPVSVLTDARTEQVKPVTYGGVSSITPRRQHCVVDGFSREAAAGIALRGAWFCCAVELGEVDGH
jgi:hypothetical protein